MNIMFASLVFAAASAAHSPFRPLPPEPGRAERAVDGQGRNAAPQPTGEDRAEKGRAGLPYAFGRRFQTLNAYLLHLQNHAAPVDLPWWRKVGPDRFERVTASRKPAAKQDVATRAELMQRYGFTQ